MFQEEIADKFAAHLASHLRAYLTLVNNRYLNDRVELLFPKSIETNNLVGGVYNAEPADMPAYAVDIISKTFSGTREDLWTYAYEGHIAGVVSGSNEEMVNKLCKRHEQATELFIRKHQFFHQMRGDINEDEFTFAEVQFVDAAFSGAEQVGSSTDGEIWMAGFRIDITIIVSEDGPGNHETENDTSIPLGPSVIWCDIYSDDSINLGFGPILWSPGLFIPAGNYVRSTVDDTVWENETGVDMTTGGSEPDLTLAGGLTDVSDGDGILSRVDFWQPLFNYVPDIGIVVQPPTPNGHVYGVSESTPVGAFSGSTPPAFDRDGFCNTIDPLID